MLIVKLLELSGWDLFILKMLAVASSVIFTIVFKPLGTQPISVVRIQLFFFLQEESNNLSFSHQLSCVRGFCFSLQYELTFLLMPFWGIYVFLIALNNIFWEVG